jgi:hypothetical protein
VHRDSNGIRSNSSSRSLVKVGTPFQLSCISPTGYYQKVNVSYITTLFVKHSSHASEASEEHSLEKGGCVYSVRAYTKI